jgi:hypothetical protein
MKHQTLYPNHLPSIRLDCVSCDGDVCGVCRRDAHGHGHECVEDRLVHVVVTQERLWIRQPAVRGLDYLLVWGLGR